LIQESRTKMSVPIQKSAPDQLAGGQRLPVEGSDEQYNRCGYKGSQVFPLTGRPGKQVDNDVAAATVSPNNEAGAASRTKEDVSGMNAGSGRSIAVTPVDRKTIQGSYPGDSRRSPGDTARAALHQAAEGQGGPRSSTGQFPNGKNDTAGKGGAFGNEHSNASYPEVDSGD
jgi:hypothetical protein